MSQPAPSLPTSCYPPVPCSFATYQHCPLLPALQPCPLSSTMVNSTLATPLYLTPPIQSSIGCPLHPVSPALASTSVTSAAPCLHVTCSFSPPLHRNQPFARPCSLTAWLWPRPLPMLYSNLAAPHPTVATPILIQATHPLPFFSKISLSCMAPMLHAHSCNRKPKSPGSGPSWTPSTVSLPNLARSAW
jgi:hypothetical protein